MNILRIVCALLVISLGIMTVAQPTEPLRGREICFGSIEVCLAAQNGMKAVVPKKGARAAKHSTATVIKILKKHHGSKVVKFFKKVKKGFSKIAKKLVPGLPHKHSKAAKLKQETAERQREKLLQRRAAKGAARHLKGN